MTKSTVDAAKERFAAAGLPFPYLPPELVPGFAELGDWVYGTRPDPAWLYDFDGYVDEGVTTEVGDYVLAGQAGHGIQSYAMHYYLMRAPLAVFLQIAWGGAYTDAAAAIAAMTKAFTAVEALAAGVELAVAEGRIGRHERLVVAHSEFDGSAWVRLDGLVDEESLPGVLWTEDDDPLASALAALSGTGSIEA